MRFYKKILILILSFTAFIGLFTKFGALKNLPEKYELIWEMKEEPFISLLWNTYHNGKTRYETSKFVNMFALWQMIFNKNISCIKIMMYSNIKIGFPYAQELAKTIEYLKACGKEVEIWADNIDGLPQFIVFLSGSKRYLTTNDGQVLLHGFGISNYFEKDYLKKKKIEFIGFQSGDYKGGLAASGASGFDFYMAANIREFLQDLVNQAKILISNELYKNNFFGYNQAELYLQKGYFTASDALENGFIDAVKSFDYKDKIKLLPQITMQEYVADLGKKIAKRVVYNKNKAYVISLNFPLIGPITRIYGNIIRKLANDENIKVLVLYISSPGGSINCINEIYDALKIAKDKGKYIIAFIDGMAASGGYILASIANKIICSPSSMIGSIGSYISFYDYEKFLKNKGIAIDRLYTHHIEDMPDELYKAFLEKNTKIGHENFKNLVKEARKLSVEEIDDIGCGQIYSGYAACEIGLVDNIGGYNSLFNLLFALFNYQPFQFVFIPNLDIIRQMIDDEL